MAEIVLNREQVRQIDRRAIEEVGMSGLVLMENAGRGCVDLLSSLHVEGPVVIACGKGNNAGDGFVIARHLDNRGISTRVMLLSPPDELSGDAAANFHILSTTDIPVTVITKEEDPPALDAKKLADAVEGASWIVDALLGTGAKGAPRPPYDELIRRLNELPARRLAVDVPSGLDCDTGEAAEPTFHADHTCTFVATKPGLQAEEAKPFAGHVHVVDIGVPRNIISAFPNDRE